MMGCSQTAYHCKGISNFYLTPNKNEKELRLEYNGALKNARPKLQIAFIINYRTLKNMKFALKKTIL